MSTNYGQHNAQLDWIVIRDGQTTNLASTNLGVYLEEARAKKLRRANFIFLLQMAYRSIDPDLLVGHQDISSKVLIHIEGMPVETLYFTWKRWLKYGDLNYMKCLRKELWIEK